MKRGLVVAVACAASMGCAQSPSPVRAGLSPDASGPALDGGPAAAKDASEPLEAGGARAASAAPSGGAEEPPRPAFDEILAVLFLEGAARAPALAACPAALPADARVRCLYDHRYKGDPRAASLAHELYVRQGTVAGVEVPHTMDGGYRGMIRIEPAVPVGADRKHLEWVAAALTDFNVFFTELAAHEGGSPATPGTPGTPVNGSERGAFRFRPLTLRFMRSVAARTPAAYAHDWTVAYNFAGTLNVSAEAVRETMFHEVFHLNDAARGGWSPGALGAIFDVVSARCKTSIPCLSPYTPNDTIVRGGTYYSFQPGNGVVEYAAELALRYYREQRAALRKLARVKPFKCGPPENARAWALMRDEFFGGRDAVLACP